MRLLRCGQPGNAGLSMPSIMRDYDHVDDIDGRMLDDVSHQIANWTGYSTRNRCQRALAMRYACWQTTCMG